MQQNSGSSSSELLAYLQRLVKILDHRFLPVNTAPLSPPRESDRKHSRWSCGVHLDMAAVLMSAGGIGN